MSNYTKDDPDVKDLNVFDRTNYEIYLLNYDVEANAELAKGKDAISSIRESIKGGPKFEVNNFRKVYQSIFLFYITVLVLLVILMVLGLIPLGIYWLIKRDDLSKLAIQVCLILLVVVLLMFIAVTRFTKLQDDVQSYIEKIVYRLK